MIRLLAVHPQTQHWKATGGIRHWETMDLSRDPNIYRLALPTTGAPRNCSIERCPGQLATRMVMWVHFSHRHVQDTIIVLEEINLPAHDAPNGTCWCPFVQLLGVTSLHHSVPRGRRVSNHFWRRRSCGIVCRCPSRPMGNR